jgi:hypothetical protein
MASNSKNLGELLNTTQTVSPAFVSDQDNTATGYFDLPNGTTAQRPTPDAGMIRFNSTLGLSEYYNGATWIAIDAPPSVSSISPSNIADTDSSVDITISGSNFSTNPTVVAIGQDGSEITPTTVVRTDSTELVATFDGTDFSDAQEDYSIKVTNSSGLANALGNALAVNASPVWTVASGSLGTILNHARTGISITTGATDDEGATLTYAVASGSLPTGLSLNTSTGAITGDADAVGSDTTSNFTLSVTDGTNTTTRAYSITVNGPAVVTYTSVGSGSFAVPTGVSQVEVLVIGGGGGKPNNSGGAGGLVYAPAFPVTPGGSVSYTVGGGGGSDGPMTNGWPNGEPGGQSSFGGLTAQGGGGSGGGAGQPGLPGGSGGGGGGTGGGGWGGGAGTGTQPQVNNAPYGGQNFGNPGGVMGPDGSDRPGGGGGAGGAGGPGSQYQGYGGIGKNYDISGSSVGYAGGGSRNPASPGAQWGGAAGPTPAVANRGGGGGGSGVVIVRY